MYRFTIAREGGRTSVDVDTDFDPVPTCELGYVLRGVLLRVLFLRQTHGSRTRILVCREDVKYAFRHIWLIRQAHWLLGTSSAITLSWTRAYNLVGVIALGFGGWWHLRFGMLTPNICFKGQTFPNKGLPPLRTLKFPRYGGGLGLLLSRVTIGQFLVQGIALGAIDSRVTP